MADNVTAAQLLKSFDNLASSTEKLGRVMTQRPMSAQMSLPAEGRLLSTAPTAAGLFGGLPTVPMPDAVPSMSTSDFTKRLMGEAKSHQYKQRLELQAKEEETAETEAKAKEAKAKTPGPIGKDQFMQIAGGFNTRTSDVGGVDKMDIARAAMGDPTAMMSLVQDTIQHTSKNWAAAGQHFGSAITKESATGAASEGLRGIGSTISGNLGPIIGPEVEKYFKFGAAVLESVDKLREFAGGLHNANMQFAEFSGAMAGVQARQEVRDIQLSRERGNRRAADAEKLAEAKHRLDKAMAPIDDAWNQLQMRVATWLLENVAPVVEAAGKWFGAQSTNDDGSKNTWIEATGSADKREPWHASYGRPQRFNGGGV